MIPAKKFGGLLLYSAAAILLSIPLFICLGDQPVQLWDESRLMLNAWEMFHNRQFLVLHFDGRPDLWNTKPPLAIWLQTASIGLFGFSEFALRFPSALCALLTALAIMRFADKELQDRSMGVLAAFILVTMPGFNGNHVARTADFDAPLILFLTLSVLSIFKFSENRDDRSAFLACVFAALAVWTKGVAGLFFLPGALAYVTLTGSLRPMISSRGFIRGALLATAMIAAIYLLREWQAPGYLAAVWKNEIGGRFFQVNEGHVGPFRFYVRPLLDNFWMLLLPAGIFPLLLKPGQRTARCTAFLLSVGILFFLVISVAKTKLVWYSAPVYPVAALLIAAGLVTLAGWTAERWKLPVWLQAIVLLPLFYQPVKQSVYPIQQMTGTHAVPVPPDDSESYDMIRFLKSEAADEWGMQDVCFVGAGYQPHIDFYLLKDQWRGGTLRRCPEETLESGRRVIYWQEVVDKSLYENFIVSELHRSGIVRMVRIRQPETDNPE